MSKGRKREQQGSLVALAVAALASPMLIAPNPAAGSGQPNETISGSELVAQKGGAAGQTPAPNPGPVVVPQPGPRHSYYARPPRPQHGISTWNKNKKPKVVTPPPENPPGETIFQKKPGETIFQKKK